MNDLPLETENETELWAMYSAISFAKKPEEAKIRALAFIARLNARIYASPSGKDMADKFKNREISITAGTVDFEDTSVLGEPGFLITDRFFKLRVPTTLESMDISMKAFNDRHLTYEVPALIRLAGDMLGYAEEKKILDPKKKRNADQFKQMLGKYSSTSPFDTGEVEFIP